MLLGNEAVEVLRHSHVAVFGVGGVGGYVVEVLARSGVGTIDIIDNDRVSVSNINRQIIALHSTVGRLKVDVMEERIKDINPECTVNKFPMFYLPEDAGDLKANSDEIDLFCYDYVVDCIDTVSAKIDLIRRCYELGIPLLSCMGAANKMDATAFRIADINETNMDPLAKVIRKKLRKLNIPRQKVVYSEEEPIKPEADSSMESDIFEAKPENSEASCATSHRPIPASNAFVPATAGLIAGGEVIKDIIARHTKEL